MDLSSVGDYYLNCGEVTKSFGQFLKYVVSRNTEVDFPSEDVQEVDLSLSRDAFQVMLMHKRKSTSTHNTCTHECSTRRCPPFK